MPPKADAKASEPKGAARFGRVRNSLKMGIVGLPNVGKSSLFNLLTEQNIAAENYPFCTIDPNESRCAVPDERYDWLCDLWKPPSMYPAYLHVTDIAGLVRGAAEGAGLGNAFLSHISAVDGIFHVVRAFDNDEVVHVDDSIDPIRDLETIQMELCKKDLEFVTKAEEKELRDVKKSQGMKISLVFTSTFEKVKEMLKENKPVRCGDFNSKEGFKELNLIYFFTAGETEVRCWTIQRGTLAPGAAGVIHSDFERGFIKAEVVAYDDFRALATSKSMMEVKAAGKYRQEGKQYVVEDGDIIHFQFNVTASGKK
ncbi:hypothetical protein GPECTOR_208g403 [Gonium pectorale]|uniref:OBG-type G domain-containing protein n=1 Tax=Gonium pectorale TaxID=33097 RepID=A0A150FWV4_GONPE|nr:hypothetical protein GPECTOR_208g403 [Gonium pectorale]|eukprot:KXZ42091.1 hypothetical protein GPECTOR_208g403 [Gonium pectorale]